MTNAPVLRSSALQRAAALVPVRPAPSVSGPTFAATLAKAETAPRAAAPAMLATRATAATPSTAGTRAVLTRPQASVATVAASASAVAADSVPFQDLIASAATKHGVPPALLAGLVKAESGFNPNAQSGVGAKGLTQLMDATARGLGVTNPFDPAQALDGGAKFLGGLLKQFKGDESLALAAYNAGPGAVQKYGGIPPYQETQRYVPKVLGFAAHYRRIWAD